MKISEAVRQMVQPEKSVKSALAPYTLEILSVDESDVVYRFWNEKKRQWEYSASDWVKFQLWYEAGLLAAA